jgi:tetratricopeptide (TPR) repeat protein
MSVKHLGNLVLLLVLLAGAARSDEILLVDGRKIVGEIIEEKPDSVTVRVPYGTFRLPRKRILSITRQDKFKYHIVQGDHFSSRGQLKVAIGEYRKALFLRPGDKVAKAKLYGTIAKQGRRLLTLKRHADARKLFEKLAKLDPGNLDATSGLKLLLGELAAVKKLVQLADRMLATGRHREAIGALERAMRAAPEMRADISNRLAGACRGAAEQLYSAKRFSEAAEYYARALSLKPDIAPQIEGRFISSVIPGVVAAAKSGNNKLAMTRLKMLLGFAPTDPRVLYLAGTVYANQNRLAEAATVLSRGLGRSWHGGATREQVVELHGRLKKALGGGGLKLDKPFSERYTESEPGDWKKLESDRFVAYHHNEKVASLVLQSAEYYVDRVLSNMGLPKSVLWKGKCPLYIYRNKADYRKASGQAEWSGGVSSVTSRGGKLLRQKIQSYQTAPKLLNSVLPHELGHLVFMSSIRYGRRYPLAMHEGVAVYNELAYRRSFYRGVLKTHLRTETTLPMGELLKMKKYPAKPDLFYAQGASFVQYLISARGKADFYKFSLEVEKLGTLKALTKYYGFKDYAEVDSYWRTWAKK